LFADLVGKQLANALQVTAEPHAVVLHVYIAQLGYKVVKNGILFS
jgi:hypothetical protein